jgi:hypothetical protein
MYACHDLGRLLHRLLLRGIAREAKRQQQVHMEPSDRDRVVADMVANADEQVGLLICCIEVGVRGMHVGGRAGSTLE